MEIQAVQGLKWTKKFDYEGRMFLIPFNEKTCRKTIADVEQALSRLPFLTYLNGEYAHEALASEHTLRHIAHENPELFLYGIRAALQMNNYRSNDIYRSRLPQYLADAINANSEEYMPVFKHMLKVWPHISSWHVVNNILCRAYALINVSDMDCIPLIANGILRGDSYNWRVAFDAMMLRAKEHPEETKEQFRAALEFMHIYGENARGMNGIILPQDIFSKKTSRMRVAFEAQEDSMQDELIELRDVTVGNNPLVMGYLSQMGSHIRSGDLFKNVSQLIRTDPSAARQKTLDEFNVRTDPGWNDLKDPRIMEWLSEIMHRPDYPFSDKQQLAFKLSNYRRICMKDPTCREARNAARIALTNYQPLNDSPEEQVLAQCCYLLALSTDTAHDVEFYTIKDRMISLIELHAGMDDRTRARVDLLNPRASSRDQKGGIWRNLLMRYSLQPSISMAVRTLISRVKTDDADAVRRILRLISVTYSPANLDVHVLGNAVPHADIIVLLKRLLAFDPVTRRYALSYDFMAGILSDLLDSLEAILSQETYDRWYKSIINDLHLYCSAFPETDKPKVRTLLNTLIEYGHRFQHS